MNKSINGKSVLFRSGILYVIIAVIIFGAVDLDLMAKQYNMYLMSKYVYSKYMDYKAGALYFESMTRLYPDSAEAYAQLGICYYKMGDTKRGVGAYSKAIALDPSYKVEK